jgi:chromosome condensin MukBEF ATPase and DNA-binding subunit MukB
MRVGAPACKVAFTTQATLITELAESGAGDQTIMDIAGHVSRQMLKHYSHIRMQAKREALEGIWKRQQESQDRKAANDRLSSQDCSTESLDAHSSEGESLQKSLQSRSSAGDEKRSEVRKSLKTSGSPSATLQEMERASFRRGTGKLLIRYMVR